MTIKTYTSGWTVLKEVTIASPPNTIFEALTTPTKLNAWFTSEAKVDFTVGGRYTNADGDEGRFLEIAQDKRLRFTWDNPGHAPNTIVEIILQTVDDETRVTLIHSGFSRREDFEHYASRESGWNWALENLKKYLEENRTTSYEDYLKTANQTA